MEYEIKKVVVAGASGNLGPAVVTALLAAGFQVSVLIRAASTNPVVFPTDVHWLYVDYASHESLIAVLRGQDAVVSTLAVLAQEAQKNLIDAAVEAGVKRFLPSEYGLDSTDLRIERDIKAFAGKIGTRRYLETKVAEGKIDSTVLITGLYLDYCLKTGMIGFDINKRIATIYDGGNMPLPRTNLNTVAMAIANILARPASTRNRVLVIRESKFTQAEILAELEKATAQKWDVINATAEERLESALEALRMGDISRMRDVVGVASQIPAYNEKLFDDERTNDDMELLDLNMLRTLDLPSVVDRVVRRHI